MAMANLSKDDKARLFDILELQTMLTQNEDPNDPEIKIATFQDFFEDLSSIHRSQVSKDALDKKKQQLSASDIMLLNRYTNGFLETETLAKNSLNNPQSQQVVTKPQATPKPFAEQLASLNISTEQLVNKNKNDIVVLFQEQTAKIPANEKEKESQQLVQTDVLKTITLSNAALSILGIKGAQLRQLAAGNDEERQKMLNRIYRQAALKHHPDKNGGTEEANKNFQAIGAAYQLLIDKDNNPSTHQYLNNIAAIPEESWQRLNNFNPAEEHPVALSEAVAILNENEAETLASNILQITDTNNFPLENPTPSTDTDDEDENESEINSNIDDIHLDSVDKLYPEKNDEHSNGKHFSNNPLFANMSLDAFEAKKMQETNLQKSSTTETLAQKSENDDDNNIGSIEDFYPNNDHERFDEYNPQFQQVVTKPQTTPRLFTEELASLNISTEQLVNKSKDYIVALFQEQMAKIPASEKEKESQQLVQTDVLKTITLSNAALSILGIKGAQLQQLAASNDEERKKMLSQIYRQLALQHHPDKNGGTEEANKNFQAIGAAYQLLIDKDNNPSTHQYLNNIAAIPEESWQRLNNFNPAEEHPVALSEAVDILNENEAERSYTDTLQITDTNDLPSENSILGTNPDGEDEEDVEHIVLHSDPLSIPRHENRNKEEHPPQIIDISDSRSELSDISYDDDDITSNEQFVSTTPSIPTSSSRTEREESEKQTTSMLESAYKVHMKFKALLQRARDSIGFIGFPEISASSIFKSKNFQSKPQESTPSNIQTRFNMIKEKVYAFLNRNGSTKSASKEKREKIHNIDDAIEMMPISLSSGSSPDISMNIERNFGNTVRTKEKNNFTIPSKQQTSVNIFPETTEAEPIEVNKPINKTENFLPEQSRRNQQNQLLSKGIENFENILFLDNGRKIHVVKSDKSNELSSRFQAAQRNDRANENKSFEIVAVKPEVRQNSSSQQQAASEKFVLLEKTKHNPDPVPKLEVFKGVVTSLPGQLEAAKTLKSQQELAYLMVKTFQLFPNKSGILEVRGGTPEFRQIIKDEALKQGFSKDMIKLEGIELPAQTSSTKEKTRDELPEEEYHSSMTPP